MVIVKWFKKKIAEREEQIWREDKEYREGMVRRQAERKAQIEEENKEKEARKMFYGLVREEARKLRMEREMRESRNQLARQQANPVHFNTLPHQIHMHQTYDIPTPREEDKERHYKAVHGSSFSDHLHREVEIRDSGSDSSSYSSSSYDSGSSSSYDSGGGSFD